MLSVGDPLNLFVVGGRSFFQYSDSVQSFAKCFFFKNSIFAYKLSPYFIDHIFYGTTQFSLQNKAVGVLCLTLFGPHQTKGNMTHIIHPIISSGQIVRKI